MAKKRKKADLGKGLGALLSNISAEQEPQEPETNIEENNITPTNAISIAMIPVEAVEVNPWQPRSDFEIQAMNDLVDSIKLYGLIQPITVRKLDAESYQLISGERRLRASKKAGLTEIPGYIRQANDQEMMEMALVENIERSDLNPMEVAITYGRLKEEFQLTDKEIADRVDNRRSSVTNYLRLLKLPEVIQKGLREKAISMGHAKAICGVDVLLQTEMYNKVLENGLSVRAAESLAAAYNNPKKTNIAKETLPKNKSSAYQDIEDGLCKLLDRKVQLKRKNNGKGQIVIPFMNDTDLNSILEFLEKENF